MAGSTFGIVMIVIAAVAGLVVMLTLTLSAAERPYFKHSHPDPMPSKVRGGVHIGDPRSLGAPQDEPVRDAVEEVTRAAAGTEPAPEPARTPESTGHGRRSR